MTTTPRTQRNEDRIRVQREQQVAAALGVRVLSVSRRTRNALLGEPAAEGSAGPPQVGVAEEIASRVIRELRSDGHSTERIMDALAVSALDWLPEVDDLKAQVAAIDAEADLARRSGRNFTVTHVRRMEQAHRPQWWFTLRRLDTGEERTVRLRSVDLHDEWSFERACLEQINLLPVLKDSDRGDDFRAWVSYLVGHSEEDARAGGASARVDGQADALLVLLVRELVDSNDGAWHGTSAKLWQALTASAARRGPLPLGWPKAPNTLTWALLRCDRAIAKAELEWARGLTPDKRRDRTISFRALDGMVTGDSGMAG